ncbi:MAG: cation:proton antiporter, partial [Clostridia bacterium]|nr:cation:proton antiporter [Clostridia bacterium]
MKKIALIILVTLFGIAFLIGISKSIDLFTYNDSIDSNSVANGYINKDVTGSSAPIIFGETSDAETGSANMVTSIVVNYRSFDTLGEVTVLFVSSLGVAILFGSASALRKRKKSGFILKAASK